MEAERFRSLTITGSELAAEREVVKEEIRDRYENAPLGPTMLAIRDSLFAGHPYRWMAGGFPAEIDAVTLDDARAFHARWYGAANAVLAIAGARRPRPRRRRVERAFGALPKTAIKRPDGCSRRRSRNTFSSASGVCA